MHNTNHPEIRIIYIESVFYNIVVNRILSIIFLNLGKIKQKKQKISKIK